MIESVRHYTLRNGLRLVVSEMPHMESVSVGFWVGVGGRHERQRINGISHFVEHLLFKGTERRSARKIAATIEGAGGYLNAFTAEDHTCYFARGAATHLETICDVLCDMYTGATFPSQEVERERGVICEEIAMIRDQPGQHVQELLAEAMYPGHPLGRPLTGTLATVGSLGREDLLDYRRRCYTGASTVVSLAGKVTLEEAMAVLEPRLENLPRGRRPRFSKWEAPASARRMVVHQRETEQVHLSLGCHLCGRHSEERFALKLLNVLLGENMSSRLFQQLRERRGICYAVHSSTSHLKDVGVLEIYAGLETGKVRAALRAIGKEFQTLGTKPPSKSELKKAKEYVVGLSRMGLEGTSQRMMWLGESMLEYDRVVDPVAVENRLWAVEPGEIRHVARRYLHPGKPTAALIGPLNGIQHLEELL